MNHAASLNQTTILQRPHASGSMLGWGISLLIHAFAVAWLWHAWLPRRPAVDAGPVTRIEVRLVPIAPEAPLQAPVRDATVSRSSPARKRAAPRPTPLQRPPRASEVSAPPTAPVPQPPADAVSITGSGADAPIVDLAAARAAARLIARENGKGLVALPSRKPVTDPNADHHVVDPLERARRADCQTARAGSTNLLANVAMLAVDLAKNAIDDSGCKW